MNRWKVRKWRNYGLAKVNIWDVFEPDGTLSMSFYDWHQAMEWATSIGARVEYWLEYQR